MAHTPIKGYRELSEDELRIVNEIKDLASEVGDVLDTLQRNPNGLNIDPRWLATGKTDLQKGFMSVIRAITQPETF